MTQMHEYQCELHAWGRGNQVILNAETESFMVISAHELAGDTTRLLGIDFDPKLRMAVAIQKCIVEAA